MKDHAKPAPPSFDDVNIRPLIRVLERLAEFCDDAGHQPDRLAW